MAEANTTASAKKVKQPSSRLLGMKFMQRSLEKKEQEKLERERKRLISEAEWVLDYEQLDVEKPKIRVNYQPSYLAFDEKTTLGRQSFKEFNRHVEENSVNLVKQKQEAEAEERQRKIEEEEDASLRELEKRFKKDTLKRPLMNRDTKQEAGSSKRQKPSEPEKQGFIKPQ